MSSLLVLLLASRARASQPDIFTVKVGDIEVSMLSEVQRDGSPDILIGASKADIEKFMPDRSYKSAVAAYLIKSPEDVVLVDTGFGREIERNIKSLGLQSSDIRALLITHSHGDHIGGLLKDGGAAYPGAKVFISKLEYDWSAQVRESLAKYGDSVELITPGTLDAPGPEIIKGVTPIAAYGHTPGHTIFLVESKGEKLMIWGDLTHVMAIQAPRPGISVTYDSDPDQAASVRKSVLKFVSDNKIPVAGMHIAYPGIGDILPDPDNLGGYKFIPSAK
jgi:glyoxylase-like metal-dependent hydrolase (beta-lactamase superfamily II)